MSNAFIFHGSLEIEIEVLKPILDSLFDASKIRYRYASDVQQEVIFNDDNTEFHIYEDFVKGYLFQAEIEGTISDAQNFIDPLASELISKNIKFQFQWNEYDDDDNVISGEYEVTNPPDNGNLA